MMFFTSTLQPYAFTFLPSSAYLSPIFLTFKRLFANRYETFEFILNTSSTHFTPIVTLKNHWYKQAYNRSTQLNTSAKCLLPPVSQIPTSVCSKCRPKSVAVRSCFWFGRTAVCKTSNSGLSGRCLPRGSLISMCLMCSSLCNFSRTRIVSR